MSRNWTVEQTQAIKARGSSLLVSAAAGSGKTAVLVQRILERITDPVHPIDVDRILVVTFTNAAAGEMRERICAALEKALEDHPENENLCRQTILLHHANIMTIHSFCLDVIRSHFQEIDLDPGFRIADAGEITLLQEDVMKDLLEEEYALADPAFLQFTQTAATGRSDQEVGEKISRFYEYSMGAPWPSMWRNDCALKLSIDSSDELLKLDWMNSLLARVGGEIKDAIQNLRFAEKICLEADGPWMYADMIADDVKKLTSLLSCRSYEAYRSSWGDALNFMRLSVKKDENVSEEKKEQVKQIRKDVKDRIGKLGEDIFSYTIDETLKILSHTKETIAELVRLCDRFEEMFSKEKRSRGIVDFHDLEHMALKILVRSTPQGIEPTDTAKEYAQYFEEIMIDEYQDSNLVQDILLSSVATENEKMGNRFMVGDVKQSIYRFRLARPELFIEKYDTYQTGEEAPRRRIDLHRNFRSRQEVIDVVNLIFDRIMGRAIGYVEYDEDAQLVYGEGYPETFSARSTDGNEETAAEAGIETDRKTKTEAVKSEITADTETAEREYNAYTAELFLVMTGDEETKIPEEFKDPVSQEAYCVGMRLKEILAHEMIWDKDENCYRKVKYADTAVLLRSLSSVGDKWMEVFSYLGIPARTETGTGYFSAPEVRTMLSFLEILDNPRQDIPLCGVLLSPAAGFTKGELAQIRLVRPDGDLYQACVSALENEASAGNAWHDKLVRFFALYRGLRDKVPYTPICDLLWEIMECTGYRYYIAAMEDGEKRMANLEMLAERAAVFEEGNYHGLFRFIRYIEDLHKYEIDYAQAGTSEEMSQSVRIMSIHKSKGLEFPVTIVGGLGRAFNKQDSRDALIMHPALGAACDWIDPVRRTRMPSLMRKALSMQTEDESLGEELRVLYVALTRAREKLIMSGTISDEEKSVKKWILNAPSPGEKLNSSAIRKAYCFLDMIMPCFYGTDREQTGKDILISHTSMKEMLEQQEKESVKNSRKLVETDFQTDPRMIYDQAVNALFSGIQKERDYPDVSAVPSKMSVSELKKKWIIAVEGEDPFDAHPAMKDTFARIEEKEDAEKTSQDRQEQKITGAQRGTLYHRVMELIDFSVYEGQKDFVRTQLETMTKCGKIPKDAMGLISCRKINTFLASSLAERMKKAALNHQLHRETPFVLGVDSSQIEEAYPAGETVLIQGIIDAWFEEEDEIVLVDYKTDYTQDQTGEHLGRMYALQLDYYAQALERLTGRRVKECILYSFCLGKEIETKRCPGEQVNIVVCME